MKNCTILDACCGGKMKTELTTEQSQHLIELGVPECFASHIDYRKNSIFTLENLLKILPKEIEGYGTRIIKYNPIWGMEMAFYDRADMVPCKAEELIDALYELTVWCLKKQHLKFD